MRNNKTNKEIQTLQKEQNARLDVVDATAKEVKKLHPEESFIVEEKKFGLGLTSQKRTTRSNAKQTIKRRAYMLIPPSRSPRLISQEALNAFAYGAMSNPPAYSPARSGIPPPSYEPIGIENFCAPVIPPTSGTIISKYKELANNQETREVWISAFGKEFGGLTQGDNRMGGKGSTAIFVLDMR